MLSDKIRALRLEKNNMTQEELAKALDISQSTITMIETNKRKASSELLIKIADFFECSVDYLLGKSKDRHNNLDKMPIGTLINIPVIGTVKAGPNGLAYEDQIGYELAEKEDTYGGNYFYLQVKGDSMINEGIFSNDFVLIREQNEVEYGQLAVVIVDGEEGTLKKVYKQDDSITLQAANPLYPPRTFIGKDMGKIRIVGKVKGLMRKFY